MINSSYFCIFLSAALASGTAGASEVRFRTIVDANPKEMVEANIYQGMPENRTTVVAIVKKGTRAQKIDATPCTPGVTYFARPKSESVYQYDPAEVYACTDGPEITFRFAKRKVAVVYEMFLDNDDPQSWGVDSAYFPAIKGLKVAYDNGEIGKAVKISTELTKALASAGQYEKAKAFRTFSLATTGIYLDSLQDAGAAVAGTDTNAGLAEWKGRLELTPEVKEKVVKFQSTCGAESDQGRIGWKTMSCLPGGTDVQLRAYVPSSAVDG